MRRHARHRSRAEPHPAHARGAGFDVPVGIDRTVEAGVGCYCEAYSALAEEHSRSVSCPIYQFFRSTAQDVWRDADRLLHMLSMTLVGKPYRPLGAPPVRTALPSAAAVSLLHWRMRRQELMRMACRLQYRHKIRRFCHSRYTPLVLSTSAVSYNATLAGLTELRLRLLPSQAIS